MIISFVGILLGSLIILKILAGFLGKQVKDSSIGALDRGLGILFGVARGMLLISFIYLLTTPFISKNNYPDSFQQARSRSLIEYGASILNSLNPLKDEIDFDERRKDMEALDRLKDMVPSFPSGNNSNDEDALYEKENREELDKLIKDSSKI